ncbi:hypothetical protein ACFOPN_03225 [Xanthomonas hyacinthi]
MPRLTREFSTTATAIEPAPTATVHRRRTQAIHPAQTGSPRAWQELR